MIVYSFIKTTRNAHYRMNGTSIEQNKKIVGQYFTEFWGKGNVDIVSKAGGARQPSIDYCRLTPFASPTTRCTTPCTVTS